MRAATSSPTRPARAYVDDTVPPSGLTASQNPKLRPRVTVITDHSAGSATTGRGGRSRAGEARAGGVTRQERSERAPQTANSSRTSFVRLCSNQNDRNGIVPASAVARVREAFHRALIARSRVMNRYKM